VSGLTEDTDQLSYIKADS